MSINYATIGAFYDPQHLSSSILYESTQGKFWTRFLRENYVKSMGLESIPVIGDIDSTKVTFSGAPIETLADFEKGGDILNVPMRMRYIQTPVAGRTGMQGRGEEVRWLNKLFYIWNTKAVFAMLPDGTPDNQIFRDAMANSINNDVRPAAAEWYRDWAEGAIQCSYLEGVSPEVSGLHSVTGARTDVTGYSHGNMYVAGSGRVPIGATAATRPGGAAYETAVITAVNAMMAQPANVDMGFTRKRLIALRNTLQILGVTPVQTPYGPLYMVVLKTSQLTQLLEDAQVRTEMIHALPKEYRDNPLFAGQFIIYEHCAIFSYPSLFGIQTLNGAVVQNSASSLGMPAYGPANGWMGITGQGDNLDTNECAVAVAFGSEFLYKVYGKTRIKFSTEIWNHDEKKEFGMKMWCSYGRPDQVDTLNKLGYGAGAWESNRSSALLVTRSPFQGAF